MDKVFELLSGHMGMTLDQGGKMFVLAGDLQRGIFTKKVDEPDIMETAAARQIMHREAPIDPKAPV